MTAGRSKPGGKKKRRGKAHPRGRAGGGKARAALSEVEKILATLRSGVEAAPGGGFDPERLVADIAADAPRIKSMAAEAAGEESYGTAESLLRGLVPYMPQDSDLWSRLGDLFLSRGVAAGAVGCYRKARLTAAAPDAGVALKLSVLHRDMGHDGPALALAREAAGLAPSPEAAFNLALCLKHAGLYAEAVAALDAIGDPDLVRRPDLAAEREELELHGLGEGAAWRYRHERDRELFRALGAPIPYWDGGTPGRLLVDCRCSLAEALMALRFLPALRRRGQEVTLRCPEPVGELFSCFGPDAIDPVTPERTGWPAEGFDAVCSPRSLPHFLDIGANGVPGAVAPTLPPGAENIALPEEGSLKVGIVWAGEDLSPVSRRRVVPPAMLLSLALEFDRIAMVSFQKGDAAEALVQAGGDLLVANVAPAIQGFVALSALLKSLDVAVMADCALAHLAAVQGVPVIVLLDAAPRPIWGPGGDRTGWYPSVRLLRQTGSAGWDSVFTRLREALGALAIERARTGQPLSPERCLAIIDGTLQADKAVNPSGASAA